MATNSSQPPRVETIQPPRVVSPPEPLPAPATPKKLLSNLKASSYWDMPVGQHKPGTPTLLATQMPSMPFPNANPTNGLTTNHGYCRKMHHGIRALQSLTTNEQVHIANLIMSISPTPSLMMSPVNSLNTGNSFPIQNTKKYGPSPVPTNSGA